MPSGRKPQPANLKLLKGRSPGRDSGGRVVNTGPAFVRSAPTPPAWLDREAKAEWRRIVPELERLHLLSQVTRASLVAYCECWSSYVAATKAAHEGVLIDRLITRRDGTVIEEKVTNPALTEQRLQSAELRRWATEYGLTPASEQKIKPAEADDGTSSAIV